MMLFFTLSKIWKKNWNTTCYRYPLSLLLARWNIVHSTFLCSIDSLKGKKEFCLFCKSYVNISRSKVVFLESHATVISIMLVKTPSGARNTDQTGTSLHKKRHIRSGDWGENVWHQVMWTREQKQCYLLLDMPCAFALFHSQTTHYIHSPSVALILYCILLSHWEQRRHKCFDGAHAPVHSW